MILILACVNIHSQDKQETRIRLMAVPQYLFKHGARIDLDIRLTNQRWLILSPYVYLADKQNRGDMPVTSYLYANPDFNKMVGFGLGIAQRHYLNANPYQGRNLFYMEYGAVVRDYTLTVDGNIWETQIENGLPVLVEQPSRYDVNILNLGVNLQFGWQILLSERLYADWFLGCGMRYSIYDRPETSTVMFNNSTADFGYTGTLLCGGMRLGFGL